VAGRLRQCGFTDISDVVRLGAQLAPQCGLSDARVTSDANYVEIGLIERRTRYGTSSPCWHAWGSVPG